MPLISQFHGIKIFIYLRDHGRPHIHVEYGEYEARILLQPLKITDGQLPNNIFRLVRRWARQHENELMTCWIRSQSGLEPGKIKPIN